LSQKYTGGTGSIKRSEDLFEQLVGMAQMAVADGKVTRQEAKIIHNFLQIASHDPQPIFTKLLQRTNSFFEDGVLDDDEAQELLYLLDNIAKSGGVTQILGEPPGELLNEPKPNITIDKPNGNKFDKWVLDAALRYKHETPKINAMFEIFEPIAVPKAISSFPFITAEMATNISGAEVPAAISVKPTTKSLIPRCFAITEE